MKRQEKNRVIMVVVGLVLMLTSGFFKGNIPSDYNPWLLSLGVVIAVVAAYRQLKEILK